MYETFMYYFFNMCSGYRDSHHLFGNCTSGE